MSLGVVLWKLKVEVGRPPSRLIVSIRVPTEAQSVVVSLLSVVYLFFMLHTIFCATVHGQYGIIKTPCHQIDQMRIKGYQKVRCPPHKRKPSQTSGY